MPPDCVERDTIGNALHGAGNLAGSNGDGRATDIEGDDRAALVSLVPVAVTLTWNGPICCGRPREDP